MAKEIQTVLLNDLQLSTYRELTRKLDAKGVLRADVVSNYKGNVIGALVRHGALRPFHSGYKLNNVTVARRPEPKHRTPKVVAEVVESDLQLAA